MYLYIIIFSIGLTHIKLNILIHLEVKKVISSANSQTKASKDQNYSFTVRLLYQQLMQHFQQALKLVALIQGRASISQLTPYPNSWYQKGGWYMSQATCHKLPFCKFRRSSKQKQKQPAELSPFTMFQPNVRSHLKYTHLEASVV